MMLMRRAAKHISTAMKPWTIWVSAFALAGSVAFGEEQESQKDLLDAVSQWSETHGIQWFGALETEASYQKQGASHSSDLVLATAEFGFHAKLRQGFSMEATLLWEEDDTEPIDLDIGILGWENILDTPFYTTVGKQYLPFGSYESQFIQDPMTLEMGETRETALIVGFQQDRWDLKFGLSNGSIDGHAQDRLDDVSVKLDLHLSPRWNLSFSYTSDLGDSDGYETDLLATQGSHPTVFQNYERIQAFHGSSCFEWKAFTFIAEILGATDELGQKYLDGSSVGEVKPHAWNLECWYDFSETLHAAVKMEGSHDFLSFPEQNLAAVVWFHWTSFSALGIEVYQSKYDANISQDKAWGAVSQWALSF